MVLDTAVLAAVASPRRREILRLVWDGEVAAGDIHAAMPDGSFGAVSLQLRALIEAGPVGLRRPHPHPLYSPPRHPPGPPGAAPAGMRADAPRRFAPRAEPG